MDYAACLCGALRSERWRERGSVSLPFAGLHLLHQRALPSLCLPEGKAIKNRVYRTGAHWGNKVSAEKVSRRVAERRGDKVPMR